MCLVMHKYRTKGPCTEGWKFRYFYWLDKYWTFLFLARKWYIKTSITWADEQRVVRVEGLQHGWGLAVMEGWRDVSVWPCNILPLFPSFCFYFSMIPYSSDFAQNSYICIFFSTYSILVCLWDHATSLFSRVGVDAGGCSTLRPSCLSHLHSGHYPKPIWYICLSPSISKVLALDNWPAPPLLTQDLHANFSLSGIWVLIYDSEWVEISI